MARLIYALLFLAATGLAADGTAADGFRYRGIYPDVPPITTRELTAQQAASGVVLIDVRSKVEYDAIHISGALHVPLASGTFLEDMGRLQAEHPTKAFAFYCNGPTSLRAYEAADKAIVTGFDRCFVYDAGLPEWSKLYPEKTLVLGRPLTNPAQQLIPKTAFESKCIDFEEFTAMAMQPGVLVFDVRDDLERSGTALPGLTNAQAKPMDEFVSDFVLQPGNQGKTLLIFDQLGKQVPWLEYFLVDQGYQHYAFLKGGAAEVLGRQAYR